MTTSADVDRPSFSQVMRERSWARHQRAEGADFTASLLQGRIDRAGYAAMVAQHLLVYRALERVADGLRDDPVAGGFITDRLTRVPHLEADLAALYGSAWPDLVAALPATERYVERLHAMAPWPGGFVAHHYTRYLGDLSGGLAIGRVVARTYGFGPTEPGVRFYHFDLVPKPKEFKDEYRARLDSADWDADEQDRVIDEVLLAYELNTAVFADLAEHVGLTGAPDAGTDTGTDSGTDTGEAR